MLRYASEDLEKFAQALFAAAGMEAAALHGISYANSTWQALAQWAQRLGLAQPPACAAA